MAPGTAAGSENPTSANDEPGRPVVLPEAATLTARRLDRMRSVLGRRLASVTVILDHLQDPHNISAVLRSCEIFGIHYAHVVSPGPAGLRLNPAVTCGCERWLDFSVYPDTPSCLAAVRRTGYRLYVAQPDAASPDLESLDFSKPVALVLGAELRGVSPEARAAADAFYHVEMHGFTQSFNVSVAAALSLYIASRKRRMHLASAGDLSAEEQEKVFQRWIADQTERRRKG
ncbi:MAG: RNA methyltransferase [Planctomycetes bacterium]|nr:RNA methyltransferase [Planctomycetota bacterium]